VEFDIDSHKEQPLVTPDVEGTYLLDPTVSPNGQSIAYISQPPPKVMNGEYDSGADLWLASRDGSAPHIVFAHERPNQLLRFPQWLDDGHVLAVVQEPSVAGGTTSVDYVLESIDVGSRTRMRLFSNVLGFTVSPDRLHIAYSMLSKQAGEALMSSALDGSNAITLIGPEQNLAPFNSPRYSPDGSTIAFASADQTGARSDFRYVSLGAWGHARLGWAASVEMDGLPEDIWTVSATGGTARRVADLKEDLPAVTWAHDVTHLYALGSGGLSEINVANGAVQRIGEGAFHGQIAWAR
jgi:Tol biopolymer transport system component